MIYSFVIYRTVRVARYGINATFDTVSDDDTVFEEDSKVLLFIQKGRGLDLQRAE